MDISPMKKFVTVMLSLLISTNVLAVSYKDYIDLSSTTLNTITNYSMFVFSEGDKKYLSKIHENQKKIITLPAYINHPDLQSAWQAVNENLNINLDDINKQGYADLRLEYKMHNNLEQLILSTSAVRDTWLINNPNTISALQKLTFDAQITIARINCLYISHSAAVDINISAIGNLKVGLNALIPMFSNQLTELASSIKSENKKDYRRIKSKWNFLEKPISSITETNIAYLAYKTCLSIHQHLELISDSQNTQKN